MIEATGQLAEQAVDHPWVTYLLTFGAAVAIVVGIVDRTLPKGLGWITRWREWMEARRRTAKESAQANEDAQIVDQQRQIDGLKTSLADLRETVTSQHTLHEEDRREWRRERTAWQAMVTALTGHTWAWRRAHDAAGHPYPAPRTPRTPTEIQDYLTDWPDDGQPTDPTGSRPAAT